MAKTDKTGPAPVSKYAAKKAALAAANKVEKEQPKEVVESSITEEVSKPETKAPIGVDFKSPRKRSTSDKDKGVAVEDIEKGVTSTDEIMDVEFENETPTKEVAKPATTVKKGNVPQANKSAVAGNVNQGPHKSKKVDLPQKGIYPDHYIELVTILKNNAEIRRFCALNIINHLTQRNELYGKNKYVSFKWNKFVIKFNNLTREYSYTEPFFLNAFVASFANFSASAQRTLDNFTKMETSLGIRDSIDMSEVQSHIDNH